MVVDFIQCKGTPWDLSHSTYVPISPITRGSHQQFPLLMAWDLTINKSLGITLDKAIVDIGNNGQQRLSFNDISRVISLLELQIKQTFPYVSFSCMQDNSYLRHQQK